MWLSVATDRRNTPPLPTKVNDASLHHDRAAEPGHENFYGLPEKRCFAGTRPFSYVSVVGP